MGDIKWHTKLSVIGHTNLLDGLMREELALVDRLVLIKSRVFAGAFVLFSMPPLFRSTHLLPTNRCATFIICISDTSRSSIDR
jgi:hypothetical protein